MAPAARDELARLLTGGTPATPSSTALAVHVPQLQVRVDGVGTLALPVTPARARRLRELAHPASYGRGEETLTDPAVRDTWQVPTELVEVDWGEDLPTVLEAARAALGLPPSSRLRAELHSMLLYEKGQFFAAHQDSEKHDEMVATMVVALPSAHSGGELLVHDGGRTARYPGSRTDVEVVVLYADRLHEVTPVRTGHRVTLTYNLMLEQGPAAPTADADDDLVVLLGRHFGTRPKARWSGDERDVPIRLAYLLDHRYTERGLSWGRLKGVDGDRARRLRPAAERAGCEVLLALVDVHEIYDAAVPDWDHGYRRRRSSDDLGDDAEPGDLIDSEIQLSHWRDPTTGHLDEITLHLDDHEVCASTASVTLTPTESEYTGNMGNYGNTIDRWYRRAAVLVWPRDLAFANRAEASPGWALEDLLERLRSEDPSRRDDALAQARSLTSFWDGLVHRVANQHHVLTPTLQIAIRLDDATTATSLLRPFRVESLRMGHLRPLGELAEAHGRPWLDGLLRGWFTDVRHLGPGRGREEWLATLPTLATAPGATRVVVHRLVAGSWTGLRTPLGAAARLSTPSAVQTRLAELAVPLLAVLHAAVLAQDRTSRTAIVEALRKDAALAETLMPTLRAAASLPDAVRADPVFTTLAEHTAGRLRARQAEPERAADDWSIAPPPGCDCELCRRLASFLADAGATSLDWPIKQEHRRHLHARIEAAELPVTHETLRAGSPYVLQLRKTRQVFERDRIRRRRDGRDLDHLRRHWGVTAG